MPSCYSTRKVDVLCSLPWLIVVLGLNAFSDPWILELHVKKPGHMVALHFCDAFRSSRPKGIPVACINYDVFNVNFMDYHGSYGLDVVSSSNPPLLFEELKLNKFLAVPINERVKIFMGGCWILPKCIDTRVAPNSSEQPTSGPIWLSPPTITRSMMHIIQSETPLIMELVAFTLCNFCPALSPCSQFICSFSLCHGNYLIKLLHFLCQDMRERNEQRNGSGQCNSANLTKGKCSTLASEEQQSPLNLAELLACCLWATRIDDLFPRLSRDCGSGIISYTPYYEITMAREEQRDPYPLSSSKARVQKIGRAHV